MRLNTRLALLILALCLPACLISCLEKPKPTPVEHPVSFEKPASAGAAAKPGTGTPRTLDAKGGVDPAWLEAARADYREAFRVENRLRVSRRTRYEAWNRFMARFKTVDHIKAMQKEWSTGRSRRDDWKLRLALYSPSGELKAPADGCLTLTGALRAGNRAHHIKFFAVVPIVKNKSVHFPVLYLLHGAYDDYTAWPNHARQQLVSLAKRYGVIVICPDGRRFGWYADSPRQRDSRIESELIRELIPHVERVFPASGRRAVAGLSMGGHGAFILSLRNPGAFVSMSSMSGILDITLHENQWHIKDVLGDYPSNAALWEEHSAYFLMSFKKEKLLDLGIMFTVATGDKFALRDNRQMRHLLVDMAVPHVYRESPGDHDWEYWTRQLPLHFAFHARALNGDMDD